MKLLCTIVHKFFQMWPTPTIQILMLWTAYVPVSLSWSFIFFIIQVGLEKEAGANWAMRLSCHGWEIMLIGVRKSFQMDEKIILNWFCRWFQFSANLPHFAENFIMILISPFCQVDPNDPNYDSDSTEPKGPSANGTKRTIKLNTMVK